MLFFPFGPALDVLLVRPHPDQEGRGGRSRGHCACESRRLRVGWVGARTPPLRDSSRDVAGGAGLRPAASGESERRAKSTLLQREGIWVLSFCWRGFAGEGRPRCTNSRRPSGSTLLLPTFYPFTDVAGREAGPGLCVCDTCISLEPSFSPIPYVYLAFQMFLFIRLLLLARESALHLEAGDGFQTLALPLLC